MKMIKMIGICILVGIGLCFICLGCADDNSANQSDDTRNALGPLVRLMNDKADTIDQYRSSHPIVKKFDEIFPSAIHNIEAFVSPHAKWRSQAALYDRYVVTLTFPLRENVEVQQSKVNWSLVEVETVFIRPDGRMQIFYSRNFGEMGGLAQWRTFVASGGDWNSLGVTLADDKPVEHFQEAFSTGGM